MRLCVVVGCAALLSSGTVGAVSVSAQPEEFPEKVAATAVVAARGASVEGKTLPEYIQSLPLVVGTSQLTVPNVSVYDLPAVQIRPLVSSQATVEQSGLRPQPIVPVADVYELSAKVFSAGAGLDPARIDSSEKLAAAVQTSPLDWDVSTTRASAGWWVAAAGSVGVQVPTRLPSPVLPLGWLSAAAVAQAAAAELPSAPPSLADAVSAPNRSWKSAWEGAVRTHGEAVVASASDECDKKLVEAVVNPSQQCVGECAVGAAVVRSLSASIPTTGPQGPGSILFEANIGQVPPQVGAVVGAGEEANVLPDPTMCSLLTSATKTSTQTLLPAALEFVAAQQ